MAFTYPVGYQPYYNNYQPLQNMQQLTNPQPMQNPQQIQNGGFVPVPSEDYARNYPVAPGNSVTFKDEKAPYVYTKTMGFSSLDRPVFEKFRLVKEEDYKPETAPKADEEPQGVDLSRYALKTDLDAIHDEIDQLKGAICEKHAKTPEKDQKKGGTLND